MTKVKSRAPIKTTLSYAKAKEIQSEKIVNLTGEPITILIDNKEKIIFPKTEAAYIKLQSFPPREIKEINKIKVIKKSANEVILPLIVNLPQPTDNTMYIVRNDVARTARGRPDVFCVDPNNKNHLIQYK